MGNRSNVVVVAEDEALVRMMAAEALTAAGFDVIEAEHADAAVLVLSARAADIHALFTDVQMPGGMDGVQLAHHTRQSWPWIALLVTSGKPDAMRAALPDGSRFLPKPYDPRHVVAHIQAFAERPPEPGP